MKAITSLQLENWLRSLSSEYDVRAPIRLHDGTRTFGRLDEGPLAIAGGAVPGKPVAVFFPQSDRVFDYSNSAIEMQKPVSKPLLVVGLTASDAESLEFIDEFFSSNYCDDIYFNKRSGAAIVVVSGQCGRDGDFLRIAGGKCDVELVCVGEKYVVAPYTKAGESIANKIVDGIEGASLDDLKKQSDAIANDDQTILMKASKLLQENKVPDEFWISVSNRCIACTACNLSCPTCTCFEVYDQGGGRNRMWDSCQLDGFMREASGHNPMGTESLRTRRRIHHKLAADVARWNTVSCFLCGRCDDVCPVGIGIKAVSREMVENYG